MVSLFTALRQSLRPVRQTGLPAIVFAAGFAASVWGYFAGARHSEAEQIAQLQETAEHYAFLLRNRLELYEGVGHGVHLARPERVASHIAEFLSSPTAR